MVPLLRDSMVLEIERVVGRPKLGAIVVFEDGDRLVAHRVVGYSGSGILAAGDATPDSPEVIQVGRIVGSVARVWSGCEPGAARVDDRLFRFHGVLRAYQCLLRVWALRMLSPIEAALRSANPRRRARAYQILFGTLEAILRNDAPAFRRHLASIDGKRLLDMARAHRCAAIVADGIDELGVADAIDPGLRDSLQIERWSAALRTAKLRAQVEDVVALLGRHELVPVLLKGAARVYMGESRCDRHPSVDIDFLLPADRIDEARRVFYEAGYREPTGGEDAWNGHHHAPPLLPPGDGLPVEIHRTLAPSGALRLATDASSLAPWTAFYEGATGRVGVLDDVGSALHLAIHAREYTPLRDLVLLAERLRSMNGAQREALYHLIDREGDQRLRLHGMVYGATRLAGLDWRAPRAAVRYFEWRLRRGDLPSQLRLRSHAIDELMAGGGRIVGPALRSLLPQRQSIRHRGLARVALFVARVAARTATTACAACYVLLMRRPYS